MNQTKNLTQWKNVTPEDQYDFNLENYQYQCQSQDSTKWFDVGSIDRFYEDFAYRLKIEPDKHYYCEVNTIPNGNSEETVKLGKHLSEDFIEACHIIRPVTESEIPEIKITGLLCHVDNCIYEVQNGGVYAQSPEPLSIEELEDYLKKAKDAGVQ